MAPCMARSFTLDRANGRLLVDDEEFPWIVTADTSLSIEVDASAGLSYVTLTIPVEGSVRIDGVPREPHTSGS